MGNIYNRQMSDVSIAMLEMSLKNTRTELRQSVDTAVKDLNKTISGLIDVFYPVGSYYDTSDPTFDPNVAWGGEWELEDEGLVHIGAGYNYIIGATGGEESHLLTSDESGVAVHDHELGLPDVEPDGPGYTEDAGGHAHSPGLSGQTAYSWYVVTNATSIQRRTIHDGSSDHEPFSQNLYSDAPLVRADSTGYENDHYHDIEDHTHELTGGYVDYSSEADAAEEHNNMQPYVVVNRWHRIR